LLVVIQFLQCHFENLFFHKDGVPKLMIYLFSLARSLRYKYLTKLQYAMAVLCITKSSWFQTDLVHRPRYFAAVNLFWVIDPSEKAAIRLGYVTEMN